MMKWRIVVFKKESASIPAVRPRGDCFVVCDAVHCRGPGAAP